MLMEKTSEKTLLRSKIWLQDEEGRPVFGQGRIKILKAIQAHGSISAAARSLGMSYRGAWNRIKASESRLGRPLLERSIGGKAGGGSQLTPLALELMQRFELLQIRVESLADQTFEEIFADFPLPR